MTGAILAGGNSSRMGRDKAPLRRHGIPLISHAADTLRALFRDVYICGGIPGRYEFLGLPFLPDLVPESGPLGGIHAALSHCAPASVFILSCDMPLVSRSLLLSAPIKSMHEEDIVAGGIRAPVVYLQMKGFPLQIS